VDERGYAWTGFVAACGKAIMNEDVIVVLEHIDTVDEEASLAKLEDAVRRVPNLAHPEAAIDPLLRIFERFPLDDAYGVFWSILHTLEGIPGYEWRVLSSVQRQPAYYSLDMVNRLLNSGCVTIGDTSLLALLQRVADDPEQPQELQQVARDCLEWQRRSASRNTDP
jgi:hypothetical protein